MFILSQCKDLLGSFVLEEIIPTSLRKNTKEQKRSINIYFKQQEDQNLKSIRSFFETSVKVKSDKREATVTKIDWKNRVFFLSIAQEHQNQENKNWLIFSVFPENYENPNFYPQELLSTFIQEKWKCLIFFLLFFNKYQRSKHKLHLYINYTSLNKLNLVSRRGKTYSFRSLEV